MDVEVLAEARREAIEKELRKQHLLATLPQSPAPWQTAAGRGLIWAGVRLVNWGTGLHSVSTRVVLKCMANA
jgi:hypothetical protein